MADFLEISISYFLKYSAIIVHTAPICSIVTFAFSNKSPDFEWWSITSTICFGDTKSTDDNVFVSTTIISLFNKSSS